MQVTRTRFIIALAGWLSAGSATAAQTTPPSHAPIVDHHQHLQSPERARIANGPPELPAITLPADLASLLRTREERWNDQSKLAELFAPQPLVLVSMGTKAGYVTSGQAAAQYLTTRFGAPYKLTPVAYQRDSSIASITGYYSGASHIGFFHLMLVKTRDGVWKISAEIPGFREQPAEKAIGAREMVAMLDAAGIKRAVVLSGAFGFGSRADLAGIGEPESVRYPKVMAENDWTARQVAEFPERLIAFCSFGVLEPFALPELERCARSGKFRGYKLHFDESRVDLKNAEHVEKVRVLLAAANRHRLAVAIHVGNNRGSEEANRAAVRTLLELIATAAPDIVIQIAHLWGGQAFSPTALNAYAEAMAAQAPGTRNLYFDMAEAAFIASHYGNRQQEILQAIASAMRRIGLERILYGSDTARKHGHLPPREAWAQFRSTVPLSDAEFNVIANNVAPY